MSEASEWLPPLLQRYTTVLAAHPERRSPDMLQRVNSLQLADTLLDKQQLTRTHPDHALQVAIIGPTQSGKSTLVNLLLDSRAAAISALAGFTVHAQGYASGYGSDELRPLQSLMQPLQRVAAQDLDAAVLDAYVLEPIETGPEALLEHVVVWDTPDFDSIDAGTYRRAVMNTLGLADIVVLAVSKDKYGDKSVWDLLALIQPLQLPLLVCINKLDSQDERTVMQAFRSRHKAQLDGALPPVILLPFVPRQSPDQTISLPVEHRAALQQSLQEVTAQVDRARAIDASRAFVEQHRHTWLDVLVEERDASREWRLQVEQAVQRAEAQYSRDYLHDPDKYDTFNRALTELLILLEVPGLAPVLTRTRNLVTWPARKLLGLGREAVDRFQNGVPGRRPEDQESLTLQSILDNTMVSLQSVLLDQEPVPFWKALSREFRQQDVRIRSAYERTAEQVRKAFEPEIEAAARRLYARLQSQPALLNSLRAARATADAAGVALAVKSGGLAPTDLVMAPAMLSVTTLLTESALGRYLDTIKAELRERQRHHVTTALFEAVLKRDLQQLSENLPDDELFAQRLEPALQNELNRVGS